MTAALQPEQEGRRLTEALVAAKVGPACREVARVIRTYADRRVIHHPDRPGVVLAVTYVSVRRLAADLGKAPGTIANQIGRLVAAGVLERVDIAGSQGRYRTCMAVVIPWNVPAVDNADEPAGDRVQMRDWPCDERVQMRDSESRIPKKLTDRSSRSVYSPPAPPAGAEAPPSPVPECGCRWSQGSGLIACAVHRRVVNE